MNADIACPCCGGVLYRVRPQALEASLLEYVAEPPLVQADELGTFVICRRCRGKVAVAMTQSSLGADVFLPTTLQSCAPAGERRR